MNRKKEKEIQKFLEDFTQQVRNLVGYKNNKIRKIQDKT